MIKKSWRANYGGQFWYKRGTCGVKRATDMRDTLSESLWKSGNYYKSRKEAHGRRPRRETEE